MTEITPASDSDALLDVRELGIDLEALWAAADKLRGSIDASEYKHVVLGLIFLKYISEAFETRRTALRAELVSDGLSGPALENLLESRDEYTAENVFWVPPEARWAEIQAMGKTPTIAKLIDDVCYRETQPRDEFEAAARLREAAHRTGEINRSDRI